MAPAGMVAAMRSDGILAMIVPAMGSQVPIAILPILVTVIFLMVFVMAVPAVTTVMAFFITVVFVMFYIRTLFKINTGGFVAVIPSVIVPTRVISGLSITTVVVSVVSGLVLIFSGLLQHLFRLMVGFR